MGFVALAIGAVASVVGTIKSAKAQRKSLRFQRQQQALQTRRSRRQAIREFQIRRASAISGAVGAGSFGGSGSFGGIGALGSQLGEQLGFSTQSSGISSEINRAEQSNIAGQTLSGLGGTAFNLGLQTGGVEQFRQRFGNSGGS